MHHTASTHGQRHAQRGAILFVALVVLVVMTLAGITLLRQMGASNAIAGNVAFKDNATSTADAGIEQARNWMLSNPTLLASNQASAGYRSTWTEGVDPTQYDWSTAGTTSLESPTSSGNTVRYIIHRLCEVDGLEPNDPSQRCSSLPLPPQQKAGCNYPSCVPQQEVKTFYRLTARVDGPRNTISYTQVLLY